MVVEAATAGVSFAAPETYTVLDPTELGDDFYNGAAFAELAERTGFTADEFERLLREALVLYVFAPATAEGFVDNITVATVAAETLPSPEQLEQTLAAVGAEGFETTVDSARGVDYVRSAYSVPIGDGTVYGVNLQVLAGGGPVEITATASTAAIAGELGTLILDTVAVT